MIDPNRPRIPKPFRTPRPMASGPARRRPAWLDLDAAAVAAGMLVATLAPLTTADGAARSWALAAVADRAPSERTALITVPADAMRGGDCGRALADALRRGGARGALLLEPVDTLCALEGRLAPPVAPLAIADLRVQSGAVVGFDQGAAASLGAFGLEPAAWVAPKAPLSVPVFSLRDLDGGAVPASALGDRVALVALATAGSTNAASALPPGDGAASALGGLLDGGARREAPGWAAPLFVLAAGVLLRVAARRGTLVAASVLAALLAALAFGQALLAAKIAAGLLPAASALLGVVMAFAGVLGAGARRRASAVDSAHGLLERAALHRLQGVHALPDADFWLRVARLAGQSHPSDAVIVADLPPGGWHLRFWNDRQGGERLVAEQRRDVRRAPFSDEPGVYKTHVLQRFLSREEVPVVAVPLLVSGELEGYVFLCGASAESTFTREPERAERLGRELALLARRRRLSRRAGAELAPSMEDNLVESAQVALGDLRLLGAALRGAPAAILIADAFGDVRLLSRELGAWLKSREAAAPADGSGALAPGELSIGDVLAAARGGDKGPGGRGAAQLLSRVMEREEGVDLPISDPEPAVLHVRAIRQESDGLSWIAGYVAALTRVDVASPAANVRSIGGRDSVDPLSAFALGELTAEAVAASARATGRTLKLEPIRGPIHTLGHRAELAQALEAFLIDMSSRALPGHQPAVSVRETPQGPQLSILDVGFGLGLPESALERVLMAPSAAPAGLETLGRLILAVEDSHGHAEVRTTDGWGITLVLTLLRAQPRLSAAVDTGKAAAPASSSAPNVIALGRKQG